MLFQDPSGFVHQHLAPSVGNDTKSYVGSLSIFYLHRGSAKPTQRHKHLHSQCKDSFLESLIVPQLYMIRSSINQISRIPKPPNSMDLNSSPATPNSPALIPVVATLSSPFDNPPPSQDEPNGSTRKLISQSSMTNTLWEARSKIFERFSLYPRKDTPSQSELLNKTPSQNRMKILYNFSTNYILREQYRDPWNEVRIGKLLQDLDAFARTIIVKHCCDEDGTTRPLLLITASVDKLS